MHDKRKINLTWDYTNKKILNGDQVGEIIGVNIISPTWFSIADSNGKIIDKGNISYVNKYKQMGYEIWPLINNNFDPDMTSELLSKSSVRESLINSILKIYKEYGFQGINIDFENIHLKDKDLLTQFIRELYPIFRENGMLVSIDVTPISISENWSLCYDRERLSEVVDYMILMTYDQHWASSPVSGSVAQYNWVEESLINVLEIVPKEKLILGVPFYTRLWTEKNIDSKIKVSSKALSMEDANKFLKDNDVIPVWDEKSRQYYGEVIKGDITYKIWLEDSKSLDMKVSLVHKYSLAGVASWRKGFETSDIWESINRNLNY